MPGSAALAETPERVLAGSPCSTLLPAPARRAHASNSPLLQQTLTQKTQFHSNTSITSSTLEGKAAAQVRSQPRCHLGEQPAVCQHVPPQQRPHRRPRIHARQQPQLGVRGRRRALLGRPQAAPPLGRRPAARCCRCRRCSAGTRRRRPEPRGHADGEQHAAEEMQKRVHRMADSLGVGRACAWGSHRDGGPPAQASRLAPSVQCCPACRQPTPGRRPMHGPNGRRSRQQLRKQAAHLPGALA